MKPQTESAPGRERGAASASFEEVCALLQPLALGGGRFAGGTPGFHWGVPYGGLLVAQALAGASVDVPEGLWVRSLHSYFIEAGTSDRGVQIDVVPVRDGRSTCWRSVRVHQDGRLLLTMELTFAKDSGGPEHQAPMPAARLPEELPNAAKALAGFDDVHSYWDTDSAFDLRYAKEPPRLSAHAHGGSEPHSSVWIKAMGEAPGDRALNAALLAYASDMCMLDPMLKPHGLWWGSGGASGFSMDHSMWFHAPARTDEWILVDQHSPALRNGRGLALADMYSRSGELLCSVAQQGTMRVNAATRS